MTIKNKVFMLNILTILISLILTFFLGKSLIDLYVGKSEKRYELDKNVYKLQYYLYNFLNFDDTIKNVNALNFHLEIISDERIIYSNLNKYESRKIEFVKNENIEKNIPIIFHLGEATIVKIDYKNKKKNFSVICIRDRELENPETKLSYLIDKYINYKNFNKFNAYVFIFLIILALLALFLTLISGFFIKKIINNMLRPLDYLIDATKRIEKGNFNQPISYKGDSEFERVCDTFNKMQENLEIEKRKNKEYEQVKKDMIDGISHDLKTPVTSIKGFIRGILDGVANTSDKKQQYLERAYKRICDVESLLQQLLSLSKIEANKISLNLEQTNISDFLNNFISEIDSEGLSIIFKDHSPNLYTTIDRKQIMRVFINIIENSKKYANVSPLIIIFSLKENDKNLEISLSDNGQGIDDNKLDKIFHQFYRIDESRNSKIIGHGLGLYIVKRIIENHNGKIFAQNNNGLSITIILPKGDIVNV